jgi:pantetheine-phosphate adenylyltransferase
MTVVYAGSFCPITNGHLNVIKRAAALCDKLLVAVSVNSAKKYAIPLKQRLALVKEAVKDIKNVEVYEVKGALVDFCAKHNATFILKSVRNAIDMQYEMDMAEINSDLTGIETLYMTADKEYSAISSTYVRELVKLKKDITPYVPNALAQKITELLSK